MHGTPDTKVCSLKGHHYGHYTYHSTQIHAGKQPYNTTDTRWEQWQGVVRNSWYSCLSCETAVWYCTKISHGTVRYGVVRSKFSQWCCCHICYGQTSIGINLDYNYVICYLSTVERRKKTTEHSPAARIWSHWSSPSRWQAVCLCLFVTLAVTFDHWQILHFWCMAIEIWTPPHHHGE